MGLRGFGVSFLVTRYDTLPLAKQAKLYDSSIGDLVLDTKLALSSLSSLLGVAFNRRLTLRQKEVTSPT